MWYFLASIDHRKSSKIAYRLGDHQIYMNSYQADTIGDYSAITINWPSGKIYGWCKENDVKLISIDRVQVIQSPLYEMQPGFILTFESLEEAVMFKLKW